jgi:hypothetical protein
MIYLAFSGAKSDGWLDNEYVGFWLGGFCSRRQKPFAAASFAFFLNPKVDW